MQRSIQPWLVLVVVSGLTGCGTKNHPTITLTASSTTFTIGQPMPITITASGTSSGAPWVDGSTPTPVITTDWGTFTDPSTTFDAQDQQTANSVQISGHSVVVKLYQDTSGVPPTPDPIAHISASYTDTAGNSVSAKIEINVVLDTSVKFLDFNCATTNIGALADNESDMEVKCNAEAFDGNKNQIPGAKIGFLAEAGAIEFDSMNNTWAYFPFHTGPGNIPGNGPEDVPPRADFGEPSYTDGNLVEHNPRDGWVTLVAYVQGDPDAVNANAAGYAPYGGAPFVDTDDSGSYVIGDPYLDIDGNGTYNTSQTGYLWKQTKVLWTGSLQNPPPAPAYYPSWNSCSTSGSCNVELTYPGQGTIVFSLVDQNLNLIAAASNTGDLVSWQCSPEPNVTIISSTSVLLNGGADKTRLGFCRDGNFNLSGSCCPGNPAACWTINQTLSLTVSNGSPCVMGAMAAPFNCFGQVERSLWTDASGQPQGQISSEQTAPIIGSADPQPSSCSSM